MNAISDNKVASIHYTLKNDAGEVLDSSDGQEPLAYLHGASNIVPGLEKHLEGKLVGDTLTVVVEPSEGYGEVDPALYQTLPRSMFGGIEQIEVGMAFHAQGENGQPQIVEVVEIDGDEITINGNHPLAGVRLHFDVEVTDIRDASTEELDHGHVHQPGGCGH